MNIFLFVVMIAAIPKVFGLASNFFNHLFLGMNHGIDKMFDKKDR